MFLIEFLLFCETSLSCLRENELFYIVVGLLSLKLVSSFCGINFTLLSIVIVLNVIHFKENINIFISFDSTNSKQQI